MLKCLYTKFYFFPKIKSAVALQNASTEHSVADAEIKWGRGRKKKLEICTSANSSHLFLDFLLQEKKGEGGVSGDIVHWPSMDPLPTPIVTAENKLKLNNIEFGREIPVSHIHTDLCSAIHIPLILWSLVKFAVAVTIAS